MRWAWSLMLVLAFVLPVWGEEDAPPVVKRTPREQAADRVLAAYKAGDGEALAALGSMDAPGPWFIVDELHHLGALDAALAFAKASTVKSAEGLLAYLTRAADHADDERGRAALVAVNAAFRGRRIADVVQIAEKVSEPLDTIVRIRVSIARGVALRLLRKRTESAAVLKRTVDAALKLGWSGGASSALRQAGFSARDARLWPEAVRLWEASLELDQKLERLDAASATLNDLGILHWRLGQYDQAVARYEASLALLDQNGDQAALAATLNNLGVLEEDRGNMDRALMRHRASLKINQHLGDQPGIADSYTNIGTLYQKRGEFKTALEWLHKALEIERDTGRADGIGSALSGIGNVHQSLGNYATAMAKYESALEIFTALDDALGIARQLHNIATVEASLGSYAEAILHYGDALSRKRKIGDKAGLTTTLNNLGLLHKALGDAPRALKNFKEVLRIQADLGDKRLIAAAHHNIGIVLTAQGEPEPALESLGRALVVKREVGDEASLADTILGIGAVHWAAGDAKAAGMRYAEALAIHQRLDMQVGIANSLINVAKVRRHAGDDKGALKDLHTAHEILHRFPHRASQASVALSMANLYLDNGGAAQAAGFAKEGVELVADLSAGLAEGEGAGARDLFVGLFEVGYRSAFEAEDPALLLWFLEQGRSGSLREALGSRDALEAAVVPAALLEELNFARAEARSARASYASARADGKRRAIRAAKRVWGERQQVAADVVARIERDAKAAAILSRSRTDDLATLQSRLAPTEALVLYALTEAHTLALVVYRDGADLRRLGAAADVREAARNLIEGDGQEITPARVAALRNLVTVPLKLRAQTQHLRVSPMGLLGYVPFALLEPEREITYVPSGTTDGLLRRASRPTGKHILALGDPVYGSTRRGGAPATLIALPATRDEVEAIGTTKLLGEAASETALLQRLHDQPHWRAVHFACHGLVDPERPMFSSLALTADKANDGFLAALEIFRMKIPADLVVLSACETGKGRIYKTEGIVGLTRAFMFAGAPRVLCSLWKVDDQATQALMIEFYRRWIPKDGSEGPGVAAALKQAQAFVRGHDKWKHPHYWAAWVLWGLSD